MNIEEVRLYCLSKPYAKESMPFGDDNVVIKVMGKMFILIDLNTADKISVKCDPDLALDLRERHQCIEPAWHFNKKYWNQIWLHSCDNSLLTYCIDHSYDEVVKKLPRKLRDLIDSFEK